MGFLSICLSGERQWPCSQKPDKRILSVIVAVVVGVLLLPMAVAAEGFRVSGLKKLRFEENINYYTPTWSPDGTTFSFETITEEAHRLYTYKLGDKRPQEILAWEPPQTSSSGPGRRETPSRKATSNFGLTWSPREAGAFAFIGSGKDGGFGLYLRSTEEQLNLTPSSGTDNKHPHVEFPDYHPLLDAIVYGQGKEGDFKLSATLYDEQAQKYRHGLLISRADMVEMDPHFAPRTGGQIVFTGIVNGNNDIYMLGVEKKSNRLESKGEALRLTNWESVESDPRWSPDEQFITFLSEKGHPKIKSLYLMKSDGSNITLLCDKVVENSRFTWHPNGRYIFFSRQVDEEQNPISYVDVRTGQIRRLETGTNLNTDVAISTDGKKIVFCAHGERMDPDLTWLSLYVMDLIATP